MQLVLDQLTAHEGNGMLYAPFFNYAYGDLSMTYEATRHPFTRKVTIGTTQYYDDAEGLLMPAYAVGQSYKLRRPPGVLAYRAGPQPSSGGGRRSTQPVAFS